MYHLYTLLIRRDIFFYYLGFSIIPIKFRSFCGTYLSPFTAIRCGHYTSMCLFFSFHFTLDPLLYLLNSEVFAAPIYHHLQLYVGHYVFVFLRIFFFSFYFGFLLNSEGFWGTHSSPFTAIRYGHYMCLFFSLSLFLFLLPGFSVFKLPIKFRSFCRTIYHRL